MVIDFSHNYWPDKPVMVLRNPDGTALQTLGFVVGLTGDYCFNEISTIEFDVPRMVNGFQVPHYDDIVGYREVELIGVGVFVLTKPEIQRDGVHEIKHCKAYSREQEWLRKQFSLTENVYQFWNPIYPDESLLGIMMSYMPSWHVGYVSSELITTWRNLDSTQTSLYDFAKNSVQKAYGCVFDFDTIHRTVRVYSTNDDVLTKAVYLSTENLIKEISIEEDTDNIITSLDVNGAEGVDIRAVNPTGENRIYNLDYFIQMGMISSDLAEKWRVWKYAYENARLPYFELVVEYMLRTAQLLTEQQVLRELDGIDLAKLRDEWSIKVAYLATLDPSSNEYQTVKAEVDTLAAKIAAMENTTIKNQKEYIAQIQQQLSDIMEEMKAANRSVQLSYVDDNGNTYYNFGFTKDDLLILNRMMMEGSIEESSFLLNEVQSYTDAGVSGRDKNVVLSAKSFGRDGNDDIILGEITEVLGQSDKRLFSINGGIIELSGDITMSATINRMTAECRTGSGDHLCVVSVHLGAGSITVDGSVTQFRSGCLSVTGQWSDLNASMTPDVDTPNSTAHGTSLEFRINGGNLYFTRNTTEYEAYSVEWDLYEYGLDCLNKLSWPSYSFSVDSANFLTLEDFQQFTQELELGKKVYLDTGSMGVLQPILVKAHIEYDDPSKLQLEFGSKFSLNDSAFKLVDLLEQSVSMGKTVDTNRVNFSSFVNSGASNSVYRFMNDALDAAKQTIVTSRNQDITLDSTGLWIRARRVENEDSDPPAYAGEQIAMMNSAIVFTDDNWDSARMAIGKIFSSSIHRYYPTSDTERNPYKTYYILKNNSGNYYVPYYPDNPSVGFVAGETYYECASNAYGIAAPYLVGTLIAGNELIIESSRKDNTVSCFRVDGEGASLHNASFSLYNAANPSGRIDIGAQFGIVGGVDGDGSHSLFAYENGNLIGVKTSNGDAITTVEQITGTTGNPNANFWIDMNGGAYFSGTIISKSGEIGGFLIDDYTLATSKRKLNNQGSGDYLELNANLNTAYAMLVGGDTVEKAKFVIMKNGDITIRDLTAENGTFAGHIKAKTLSYYDYTKDEYVPISMTADSEDGTIYAENLIVGTAEVADTLTVGGSIIGGLFYATGHGAGDITDKAAYYISDGIANANPTAALGWISYDTSGSGTSEESRNRVIFKTKTVPIKIQSGGDMSIEAGSSKKIFMLSPTQYSTGTLVVPYCYSTPETNSEDWPTNVAPGSIKFAI